MKKNLRTRYCGFCIKAAALCSATLFGETCEVRSRDAVVNGARLWVAQTLLSPETLSGLPFDDVADSLTGS